MEIKQLLRNRVMPISMAFLIALSGLLSPIKTVKAESGYPYHQDSTNFDKPDDTHKEQAIIADIYTYSQGYPPAEGNDEIPNWKFSQSVILPAQWILSGENIIPTTYDGSPSPFHCFKFPDYSGGSDVSPDFYDNFKFWDTNSGLVGQPDNNRYRYAYGGADVSGGGLFYWHDTCILGDNVSVEYQVIQQYTPADKNSQAYSGTDMGLSSGTVRIPWSYCKDKTSGQFAHYYHSSQVTAKVIHVAPTADFAITSATTVKQGTPVTVVDGKENEKNATNF